LIFKDFRDIAGAFPTDDELAVDAFDEKSRVAAITLVAAAITR
jgi:hypothetical protein